MTHGTELDERVGPLPDPLWRRIVADPERAPELMALAASKRFADPAAGWAREASAWHKPDRLAHKAYAKHVHLSRGEGLALGLGGMTTAAANVAGLGWIQARMVFFVAAAPGYDPHDPMRPAELLYLWGVYETPAAARESLDGLGPEHGRDRGQDPAVQAEPAVMANRMPRYVGKRTVKRLGGRDPAARGADQRRPEWRLHQGPGKRALK